MYKKLLVSLLLITGGVLSIPFAKADVQDVSFRFCDDTGNNDFLAGKKTFFVTPGEEKEICINFDTTSKSPRKILFGFTKGLLSPGGNQMCDSDKGPDNAFSKYFKNTEAREFIIDKDHPKVIKEKILLPIGMSGVQYGCFAYSLSTLEGSGLGGMFNLVVNKVFPISLFVGDSADLKSIVKLTKNSGGAYTTNNKVKAIVDKDNNLNVSFLVKNDGNISQNIVITGRVYNMLGFEKSFSIDTKNVAPGSTQEVTANVGIVPFYKGFFTVNLTLTHIPKFDFDVSTLDDTQKKGGIIIDKGQVYIFSWITLAIMLVLLASIVKFFWPRKKIVVQTISQ